jgi:hypothetical protein
MGKVYQLKIIMEPPLETDAKNYRGFDPFDDDQPQSDNWSQTNSLPSPLFRF